MDFSQKTIEFLKNKGVSNLLFFNDTGITTYDLANLNNIFSNIYVAFSNSFTLKTYYSKLKSCKNIHIVEPNHIPLINYDFISINEFNPTIQSFLNKISSLKVLYVSSQLNVETPNGFSKNINFKNLFERNIINQKNNINLKNIIDQTTNNTFIKQTLNTNQQETNVSISKNPITVKNFCPINNIFTSNNFKYFIKNGQLDVFCILETEEDIEKFKEVLKYLNENYKNTKLYIFYNGIFNSKINISKFDHILIKSSNKEDVKQFKDFLNNVSNGSFQINFNKIDLNKNILDLINEDCINITNI